MRSSPSEGTLGAILLVAGCCIGGAMLGLPVISAMAGFVPSAMAMLLCYFFTTASGLLLAEATLWFDQKVNLPAIVEHTLGKAGKYVTVGLFMLLFYCIFVAYLDGGGALFSGMMSSIFHHPVSRLSGILLCLSVVVAMTCSGTKVINRLNLGLMAGLLISYLVLVFVAVPSISSDNLANVNWSASLATVPILLICFGYQNLVPGIVSQLKKNINAIRYAIIIGNLIPLIFYLIWNFVILGMLSPQSLVLVKGSSMVADMLQKTSPAISVILISKAFSMFAILTSFVPTAMSFVDFMKDAMKKMIPENSKGEYLILLLVYVPPLICALTNPHIFLHALEFAGGFIDVLLFGVLPALVILMGRSKNRVMGSYQVMGGSTTPVIVLILSLSIVLFKLFYYG